MTPGDISMLLNETAGLRLRFARAAERAPEGSWTTDVWAPLEGRSVNGGVRWQF